MDKLSSPASSSSPTTATPSTASKQPPTYTTAGTIYNPSSSQPLQPPTRRGRSAKWMTGTSSAELSLFPKSVLAGMPIKTTAGRHPLALQQYTPLQQNYDRAVSPLDESDHYAFKMSLQTLRMRSGNTPTTSSYLFPDKDEEKAAAGEWEAEYVSNDEGPKDNKKDTEKDCKDEGNDAVVVDGNDVGDGDDGDDGGVGDVDDDDDDDLDLNPLMSMTVKSLNNLASYPNPSQKKAQKALLRGARSNLGSLAASRLTSSETPCPRFLGSPDTLKHEGGGGGKPSGLVRVGRPEQIVARGKQADGITSKTNSPILQALSLGRCISPMPAAEDPDGVPTSTTLSTGPGAPRPLTAGPPGQRQYRPSTFESTFKALTTKGQHQDQLASEEKGEGSASVKAASEQTGIKAGSSTMGESFFSSMSRAHLKGRVRGQPMSGIAAIVAGSEPDLGSGPVESTGLDMGMRQLSWDPSLDLSWARWQDMSPLLQERHVPGTDRLTEEALIVRQERIDSCWYAGRGFMDQSVAEIAAELGCRKLQHAHGAVGDGRPQKREQPQYRRMDVDEANRTPVSEHAKPLLNMAFATLVRQAEQETLESPLRQFETPVQAVMEDQTADGPASFLSKPAQRAK